MVGSLQSSSAVSLQVAPKHGFSFRKLDTEWLERPLLANAGNYADNQQMKDNYPASRA